MKTILCDINIVLDLFLKREPFYFSSAKLFEKIDNKEIKGYLSAVSFPVLFYLLTKKIGREKAIKILEKIRIIFKVAPVDEKIIDMSLVSDFKDFEDAVQYYSAMQAKVDFVITRNKSDYTEDLIMALTPEEFLALEKP